MTTVKHSYRMDDGSVPDRLIVVDAEGKGDHIGLETAYREAERCANQGASTLILMNEGNYSIHETLSLSDKINVRGKEGRESQERRKGD